jgi:chromate transporter
VAGVHAAVGDRARGVRARVRGVGDVEGAAWLHGLKLVAVAVVAHAVWGMATKLTPDAPRITVALAAAMVALVWTGALAQVAIIAGGAVLGLTWLHRLAGDGPLPRRPGSLPPRAAVPGGVSRGTGVLLLSAFAILLVVLPVAREASPSQAVGVADAFYRTGALVFGGGHVVLPLLQAEVVPAGWVDEATFVAGYGATQAVPGPLFTFSAFLGASMAPGAAGVGYAAIALVAVFAPSFLLVLGVLPYWEGLRRRTGVRRALTGVNAAVVGLLLAALYQPVWTAAVTGPRDVALVLAAYAALAVWKAPPWAVVVGGAVVTAGLAAWGG